MKPTSTSYLSNYLTNVQIDVTAADYAKVTSQWRYINLTSTFNRFYLIMEGEGYVKIENREYNPRPGQLFLLPAGKLLSFSTINDNTYGKYFTHFNATIGDFPLFQLIDTPDYVEVTDMEPLKRQFEQLIESYKSPNWTAPFAHMPPKWKLLRNFLNDVVTPNLARAPLLLLEK